MEESILNAGAVSLVNKFSNLNEEEIKNKLTESKFKIQKKNNKKNFFSFRNLKTNSLNIYLLIFAIIIFGFFIALLIYLIKNDKAYKELDYLKNMKKPVIYENNEYKLFKLKDNDLDILLIKDEKTLIASISVAVNVGYKTFNKSNNKNPDNYNINEDLGYSNLLKNYLIFTFPPEAKKKLDLFNGTITATIEDYYTIFNLNILSSEFYSVLPYFAKLFTYSKEEFISLYNDQDDSISKDLNYSTESDYYQVAYNKKKLDKRFINYFIYNENYYDETIKLKQNLDYEGINKNEEIYNKKNIDYLYEFYKKYYTSNNMKVVIYSNYKISKLIENCVHYFKNIKNSKFEFSYDIKFTNNDIKPKFFYFEQKTSFKTIKIFFIIESNKSQNYVDNYNNLNYFDYFIKKNSHHDNCTLLYKLLENGVFDIETEIYEEINNIIIYKIELSLEDIKEKEEEVDKNLSEILNKVFDFVEHYSNYFEINLFNNLINFYENSFHNIDKQDQYDFLTNFASRELFFKKEHFSKFLNYKYLTNSIINNKFEIINKTNLSNIYILISKPYNLSNIEFEYLYTYKVNEFNSHNINISFPKEKKDDSYCSFSTNIFPNKTHNKKNNNLKKSFIKDIFNSEDFSLPIMYYFSNNDIEIPKVSYILYIFNIYSKIYDDEYRLSYFLYYIQIKTLILENLFDYIEAGSSIEINTNELGIYVYIESFNYYISDIIQKIFIILHNNTKDFIPENNNEKKFYLNKLIKEIDLYNLEDPSLLNQDYFHIAMKKSPIMKYNLNFNVSFDNSYELIKYSLLNVITNGLLYGNIDYNSAEDIYKNSTLRYNYTFKFVIKNETLSKILDCGHTYKFLQKVQDIKNFSNTNNNYNIIYIISDKRVTTSFSNYYYLGEWTRENDVKADLTVSILKNYLKSNLKDIISQKNDLKVSKIIFSKQIFLDVTVTPIKKDKFNYVDLNNFIDNAFINFTNNIDDDYKKKKEIDIADNYYFLIRSLSNFITLKNENILQKGISQWMTIFMSNRTNNNDTSKQKEEDKIINYKDISYMRKKFDSDKIKDFLKDKISNDLTKLTLIFIDTKLKFEGNNNTLNSTILGKTYGANITNESNLLTVYDDTNEKQNK